MSGMPERVEGKLLAEQLVAILDLPSLVTNFEAGQHRCLLYEEDPAEQLPALVPFVQEGLLAGERCIWVIDDSDARNVRQALRHAGIDTRHEEERGGLLLWTREQWRQTGDLDTGRKSEQVLEIIADALAAGFTGVRFAVEMTWTLDPDIDPVLIEHWEATLDSILAGTPVRVVCQYNRKRLSPVVVRAGLSTHRAIVIGAETSPNPLYNAPLILADPAREPLSAERARWEVDRLTASEALRRERERRLGAEARSEEAERSRKQIELLVRITEQREEELRQANRAKDEFLSLVSHELRTPVTMVLGNADLLRARGEQLDEHTRHDVLADLHAQSKRLSEIIGNLLVLAHGNHEVEREPVLLHRLVARVVRKHDIAAGITLQLDGSETIVLGNAGYLEEVLHNLLSNAQKYGSKTEPTEVLVSLGDGEAVVSVLDRGIGIGDDEEGSLFVPFYRSPRMSKKVQGMGIGLSVCKQLLEIQGGRIWAERREGGGSVFSFALPVMPEDNAA